MHLTVLICDAFPPSNQTQQFNKLMGTQDFQNMVASRHLKADKALTVAAIIPCLNEENAIGAVVDGVRAAGIEHIIVVDGGSTDDTAKIAAAAGAQVVVERRRGYGRAIMSGIAALSSDIDTVLFIDGDGSDRTEMIPAVLEPLCNGSADFVHGSRSKGPRETGSLSFTQLLAGHLAGLLMRVAYGIRYSDMSPFRAIRRSKLDTLGMAEESFGWNLEMQMRAAASGLRIEEVAVGQRRRVGGVSKVSGDLTVAVRAAYVIVATFLRLARQLRRKDQANRR